MEDIEELKKQIEEAEKNNWEIARLLKRKLNELLRGQKD